MKVRHTRYTGLDPVRTGCGCSVCYPYDNDKAIITSADQFSLVQSRLSLARRICSNLRVGTEHIRQIAACKLFKVYQSALKNQHGEVRDL